MSGGADSLALALLARDWALGQGGSVLALIVDHRLRAGSAAEAALTGERLASQGIAACVLTLEGLARGPGLAARARTARYALLERACAERGILHLLLGHHAADQAETLCMRLLAGSLRDGLAGMPALRETAHVRLLRPLLSCPPARLRATLLAAGLAWVDDPSNADPAAQRARLRGLRRDRDGTGPATRAAITAAAASGRARAAAEWARAADLAARATLRPEGFARIAPGTPDPAALSALLRMVAGAIWPPGAEAVAALAAAMRPATLGGARLLRAGPRHGGGWLLAREAAAMQPPVAAARWDQRFAVAALPPGCSLGPAGPAAQPGLARLPEAVRRTLPALWRDGAPLPDPPIVRFAPPDPLTAAPFCPVAVET